MLINNIFVEFIEDFFIIFIIYNFFKLLFVTIINELILFSNYFNKKFNFGIQFFKIRYFSEYFNKIFNNNNLFMFFFLNYKK